jgi:AAA15 family ATPase/GTPase
MRLAEAKIRNFRGLRDIEFSTRAPVTVIVGPNAIGKTSIFEAIRLHKALLLPTFSNEPFAVLANMGREGPGSVARGGHPSTFAG